MFGKLKNGIGALKDKAEGQVLQNAIGTLMPQLTPYLDKLKEFEPAALQDDELFESRFIKPTATALTAASGGITSMIPGFEARFARTMKHVRNELLIIDAAGNSVSLADDFAGRLPTVLLEGLKQPA